MTAIEAKRTPDERFSGLRDFSYRPHYIDDLPGYEGLRMHYIDEGPADATETFLCLHGEPSWCYLYRKMAPVFLERGARVIAPDLFGFGRSDKPIEDAVYTFDFHRGSLLRFIERLDCTAVTLVVQDWGGLLGLTLPMAMPERVKRLLVMNTTLACGEGVPSDGFAGWRDYMAAQHDVDIATLMTRAIGGLDDAGAAAYAAPFPSAEYKAGVRRFPAIVPTEPDMQGADTSRQARTWLTEEWSGPTFMAVGMLDPVLGPDVMNALRTHIAGCPPPMEVAEGGHFVQEHGEGIARAACDAFGL